MRLAEIMGGISPLTRSGAEELSNGKVLKYLTQ
jgi:hypothetical protein